MNGEQVLFVLVSFALANGSKKKIQRFAFWKDSKLPRAQKHSSFGTLSLSQKDTKEVGCQATLNSLQYMNNRAVDEIKLLTKHTIHVPGKEDDIRTLPLTRETVSIIEQSLKNGIISRNVRTAILRQVDEWSNGIRKPNIDAVYNHLRKVCFIKQLIS
ncbi:uncharacterized protein B0P05DRAFT_317334 [Gilbertella persicaria]|uniref:uncharacterized protein n=1 Tax=Gilbertella persicaria TaxID=101096 RepID=UPI0022205FB1|nr:uncharacterized protein B0P05DRAFT_317334 [Gilbertella persicaria]KAI8050633.1 hypothetical protein B0P05DRAFT_317334 [Gilbertella persicaria]